MAHILLLLTENSRFEILVGLVLGAELGVLLRAVVVDPPFLHGLVIDLGVLQHLLLVFDGDSAT